jgi:hypothetical protein
MSRGGFSSWEMDLSGLDLGEGTGTCGGMENGWEGMMGTGDVDWVSFHPLSLVLLGELLGIMLLTRGIRICSMHTAWI